MEVMLDSTLVTGSDTPTRGADGVPDWDDRTIVEQRGDEGVSPVGPVECRPTRRTVQTTHTNVSVLTRIERNSQGKFYPGVSESERNLPRVNLPGRTRNSL